MSPAYRDVDPSKSSPVVDNLRRSMRERVIGQTEAIEAILRMYKKNLAGLNIPGKPLGSFLFLGPTGVGKSELVKAFAEGIYGDSSKVLTINCTELSEDHFITKLIGSPPSYVGDAVEPILSQENLDRGHTDKVKISIMVFEEFEKADYKIKKLLLQILEEAVLVTNKNRKTNFERAFIFMTSNIGLREIDVSSQPGFKPAKITSDRERFEKTLLNVARREFSPELVGRVNEKVIFKPLSLAELRLILEVQINNLRRLILGQASTRQGFPQFSLLITEEAKEYILGLGWNPKEGARQLRHVVGDILLADISQLVITEQIQPNDTLLVNLDSSKLKYSIQAVGAFPEALFKNRRSVRS